MRILYSHFYWFFKSNLEVFLDICAYKHVDKRMIDYACQNLFETDENYFLSWFYKCSITIELK